MLEAKRTMGEADEASQKIAKIEELHKLKIGEVLDSNDIVKITAKKLGINDETLQKSREAFSAADEDHSGNVSVSELRNLLDKVLPEKISDEDFERQMCYDENHDGLIEFHEFLGILTSCQAYKSAHMDEMVASMGAETRREMQFERLSPQQKLKVEGVPTAQVIGYLESEIAQMNACLQLPLAVMIFVCFALSVLLHEKIDMLHAVDKAITWDIEENANFAFSGNVPFENGRMGHKNIFDVNTHADFWSWFDMGLVSLFWNDQWDLNEARINVATECMSPRQRLREMGWPDSALQNTSDHPSQYLGGQCPEGRDISISPQAWFGTPRTPSYKSFFAVVAGMRLRQERTAPQACSNEDASFSGKLHTGECVPDPGYWLKPEVRQSLFSKDHLIDREKSVYLLSGSNASLIRQQLRALENKAWLDPYTSKVEMLYTLYNPHIGTLSACHIVFFVNRAGHFYRMVQPVTFWLNPYHGWHNYIADAMWIFMIMKIAFEETLEIRKICKRHGFIEGLKFYFSLANFIDWGNVAYTLVIAVLWHQHLVKLGELDDMLEMADVARPGSFPDDATRKDYFEHIESIVHGGEYRRAALSLYPFVVVSRFFKAFDAQPRLSLVTSTINRASTDLFHFGLVFASIFGLFALSAMILFGQDIGEFANFGRASDNSFHVLLGDFDWEVMKNVGRIPAGLWFWSFMCLVNLVMLNMLLAIVMDVYTEIRGAIGSRAETLWSQTWEIYRRNRDLRAGLRVSLEHVLVCLDPTNGHGQLPEGNTNIAAFMKKVPGLAEPQAKRILIQALVARDEKTMISQSMAEGMLGIQRVEKRLGHLHRSIQSLVHMSELSTQLLQSEKTKMDNQKLDVSETKASEDKVAARVPDNSTEAPPWFQSFSASVTQRFDTLGSRLDQVSQDVVTLAAELRSHGQIVHGLAQTTSEAAAAASVGLCGVSKAPAQGTFVIRDTPGQPPRIAPSSLRDGAKA